MKKTFLFALAAASGSGAAYAGEYQEPAITPVYTVATAAAISRFAPTANNDKTDSGSTSSGDIVDTRRFDWMPAYANEAPPNSVFKQHVSYMFNFSSGVYGSNASALACSFPDTGGDETYGIWKWRTNGTPGDAGLPTTDFSIVKTFPLDYGALTAYFDAHVSANAYVNVQVGNGANDVANATSGPNTSKTTGVTVEVSDLPPA